MPWEEKHYFVITLNFTLDWKETSNDSAILENANSWSHKYFKVMKVQSDIKQHI